MVTNLLDKIGPPRLVKKSSKSRGINDFKKASFFLTKGGNTLTDIAKSTLG